jgi:hypothetical protein
MALINFKCRACKNVFDFDLTIKNDKGSSVYFNETPYCENCSSEAEIGYLELTKKGQTDINSLILKDKKRGIKK